MTDMTDVTDRPKPIRRSRRAPSPDAALVEDLRLAALHLRLGDLALARTELEYLRMHEMLDAPGLADLAEARWRRGALVSAAAAAADHLAAGGTRPVARVIAAEAAAVAGRPGEARAHVEALGAVSAESLELLFAGMPRHAFWPSAPNIPVGPQDTLFGVDRAGRPRAGSPGVGDGDPAGAASRDDGPSPPGGPPMDGLWGSEETTGQPPGGRGSRVPESPADAFSRARTELESGHAADVDRGLTRLALVLRLDPTLAPAVLDLLGPRRDVAALLLRGDAYRLLGRRLEAEAALAAAAQALDGPERRRTARATSPRTPNHVNADQPPEES